MDRGSNKGMSQAADVNPHEWKVEAECIPLQAFTVYFTMFQHEQMCVRTHTRTLARHLEKYIYFFIYLFKYGSHVSLKPRTNI